MKSEYYNMKDVENSTMEYIKPKPSLNEIIRNIFCPEKYTPFRVGCIAISTIATLSCFLFCLLVAGIIALFIHHAVVVNYQIRLIHEEFIVNKFTFSVNSYILNGNITYKAESFTTAKIFLETATLNVFYKDYPSLGSSSINIAKYIDISTDKAVNVNFHLNPTSPDSKLIQDMKDEIQNSGFLQLKIVGEIKIWYMFPILFSKNVESIENVYPTS
eukprot:gene9175-1263_t